MDIFEFPRRHFVVCEIGATPPYRLVSFETRRCSARQRIFRGDLSPVKYRRRPSSGTNVSVYYREEKNIHACMYVCTSNRVIDTWQINKFTVAVLPLGAIVTDLWGDDSLCVSLWLIAWRCNERRVETRQAGTLTFPTGL